MTMTMTGSGSGRGYMKKIIWDECSTVVEIRNSTVVEIDHLDLRSLR